MTSDTEARRLHPIRDVADALYVTPNTIYKRINAGEIQVVRVGPRKTFVDEAEYRRLLAAAGLAS